MKSIKVKRTKTVTVLEDASYLMNSKFNPCHRMDGEYRECRIIEQDLKIPNNIDKWQYMEEEYYYLDTRIKIDGEFYYTHSSLLREKEITTNEKELFIPEFNFNGNVCGGDRADSFTRWGCPLSSDCDECICHKSNFKYLKD